MPPHAFNFEHGDILSKMGATWFVSRAYYEYVDKNHLNWQIVKSYPTRTSTFKKNAILLKYFLEKIIEMNDNKLNTNKIKVTATQTKQMILEILNCLPNNNTTK